MRLSIITKTVEKQRLVVQNVWVERREKMRRRDLKECGLLTSVAARMKDDEREVVERYFSTAELNENPLKGMRQLIGTVKLKIIVSILLAY